MTASTEDPTKQTETPQQFLEREVAEQVRGYDDSRQFYRSGFYNYTLASAVVSAVTTVLIGIGQIYKQQVWISILALVASAGLTVIAAWNGVFRHRELWIQKTDTWMALQKLEANIQFAKTKSRGVLTLEQVDNFYQEFEAILLSEHELWKKVRSTQGGAAGRHG